MDTAFERLYRLVGPASPGVHRLTLHPPTAEVARAFGGTAFPRRVTVARELGLPLPDHLPDPTPRYDEVILPLENGRQLARMLLLTAARAVRPGGTILLAADVRNGARTYESDAATLGTVQSLYAGSGCRVFSLQPAARPILTPPDWPEPGVLTPFSFAVGGRTHTAFAAPGVFSSDDLDEGSRFLLEHLPTPPFHSPSGSARVFDACCGTGVIARVLADLLPDAALTAADDDALAVSCARQTLAGTSAHVLPADLTTTWPVGPFDLILCNPPFHQGGTVDRGFVARFLPHAARALRPTGRLLLVANRFLAYERCLRQHFTDVRRLAEDTKWRLWEAARPNPTDDAPAARSPAAATPTRPARGPR